VAALERGEGEDGEPFLVFFLLGTGFSVSVVSVSSKSHLERFFPLGLPVSQGRKAKIKRFAMYSEAFTAPPLVPSPKLSALLGEVSIEPNYEASI